MPDWKNVQYKDGKFRSNGSGGGSSTLSGLTDVNISSVADGQILKYNNTTEKWENENQHKYSTSERVVSEWIDGKPVYEKVFVFNERTIVSEGSWFDTGFPTGDIKVVVFISGIDVQPVSGKGTAWHFLGADVTDTNIRIYQNRDLSKDIGLTHLIIRYTKTTD